MSVTNYFIKMLEKLKEIDKKQDETRKKLVLIEISEFINAMIKDDDRDEFAAVEGFNVFLNEVKEIDEDIANYIESIIIIEGLKGYLKNE